MPDRTNTNAIGVAQQNHRAAGRPGAERRRNPRIQVPRGFLALIGLPGTQATAVSARDLSRTGLGFFHSTDLPPGQACTITMRDLGGEMVPVQARVVRRRAVRDRVFEIGVEFLNEVEPGRFVPPEAPRRTTVLSGDPAQARAHIAELAAAMKRMAESEAPLDDLFAKIEEMVRLCDSARIDP